jgi:hypothetical protein
VPLSSYLRDKLQDHWLKIASFPQPTNIYISLHTADPGLTGASEVAGGSYARQIANTKFTGASGGSNPSNVDIDFAAMPAATITHVGIWDASAAGNFLQGGALSASKTTNAGDTFRLPSGQLTSSLA